MVINKSICDACACGGKIDDCQGDVYETVIDGCGRPLSYCSKYKVVESE